VHLLGDGQHLCFRAAGGWAQAGQTRLAVTRAGLMPLPQEGSRAHRACRDTCRRALDGVVVAQQLAPQAASVTARPV
jgi:hypothetical protein